MAGYVVMTRIDRVDPQFTVHADEPSIDTDPPDAGASPIDVVESIWDDRLAERLMVMRERWAQATFFLFDPDSWRR
ncbi:MAG: hypothetical protein ACRDIL_22495 [Candidatus Limnocylindrales bacterium]